MQIVDADVESGLLAGLAHALLDKVRRLLVHLLDARRVDAAVGDEVSRAPHGPSRAARESKLESTTVSGVSSMTRFDARDLFEGADVASLAADDAALEVVGGDVDRGNRHLRGVIGRAALDGERDDLPGPSSGTRP